MEATLNNALAFYPPAPQNGGPLEFAPDKIGDWAWQPKVDDWRAEANVETSQIWNQYGELSTVAQQGKVSVAFEKLRELTRAFDGWRVFDIGIMENRHDLMRGSIIVFDVMDTTAIHSERRAILERVFPILPLAHILLANGQVRDQVYLINEWRNDSHPELCDFLTSPMMLRPMALQRLLQRENDLVGHKFYEGLVAKRRDVAYPTKSAPKQKTNWWIKHRFDQ
jgi:hypothetical protein